MKAENKLNLRTIIVSALLIALTCVSTMVIRIPTPSFGYIHPGDGFVLLCGLMLGPVGGALCAGAGSALADLFAGYLIYVPGTFVIKALCALIIAVIARFFTKKSSRNISLPGIIIGGVVGELFMVLGYFLYEAFIIGFNVGFAAALSGVPFNLVQGVFGVIVSSVLFPIISPLYRRVKA